MKSSLEIMNMVHGDILRAKRLGKSAVDEADFLQKLKRSNEGQEIITAIKNNSATKNNITKKFEGFLASGVGNQYTFLNILTNKTISEKYNMELSEIEKDVAMHRRAKSISNEAIDILRIKDDSAYKKWVLETSSPDFKITDIKNSTKNKSIQDIMHIYLGVQNENVRNKYNHFYALDEELVYYNKLGVELTPQIASLIDNLSEEELAYADMLQRQVQGYYSDLNAVHVRETGLDLNIPENYFPMKSETDQVFSDDIKQQGETVSAQESRQGFTKPLPTNATTMALRYVHDAEHKINISEEYVELKRLFNSGDTFDIDGQGKTIKEMITENYGEFAFKTLNNIIDAMSITESSKKYNMFNSMVGSVLDNWTISKIALNPTVFTKQLISVANYAENMPAGNWAIGFAEGLLHPKKTWDYMMENIEYIEARFEHGHNEVLHALIKKAEGKGGILGQGWVDFLTLSTRAGDIMAIIYGGYPLVKHLKSQGLSSREAELAFREVTISSQQSPLASSSSDFQNQAKGNAFARTLTVFKNTPTQYFRKEVNASYQLARGEITKTQWAKTMAIYGIIAPSLYSFAGLGTKAILYGDDWKDKWFGEMMMSMALAPFGWAPILADIARITYYKATGKKVWKVFNNPVYGDVEFMARSLADSKITGADLVNAFAVTTELVTKFPATQATRLYNKNKGRFGPK
jgi:hypothetical protein